jgi:formate C-acetyltransferase
LAEDKVGEVRRLGSEPEKEAWYESVIVSLDGLKLFIRRHRDLALQLAADEPDPTRKTELREIARISEFLAEEPPQTFREALQGFWFVFLALTNTGNSSPLGRFDQNLWPFLEKDLDSGAITVDEAQELIDCLWLKINELLKAPPPLKGPTPWRRPGYMDVFMGGKTSSDRYTADDGQGSKKNMALSGLTPGGLDGTNPLTYLCLNASFRLKTVHPGIYVRFHNGSPSELFKRVTDCLREGCILSIYNDEIIVPSFTRIGIPVEHARDYTPSACWEAYPQGRTNFLHSYISLAEAMDRVLHPKIWDEAEVPLYIPEMDPFKDYKAPDANNFSSYEDIFEAVKDNIDRLLKCYIEESERVRKENEGRDRLYSIAPLPLFSAFVKGPLESGRDITQGGWLYHERMADISGLSHVADSLAAIKKLCFEDKSVEWSELLDAVRTNWEGKETLRQLIRTRVPTYGNDIDFVDNIAKDIAEGCVESIRKHSAGVPGHVIYTAAGLATFEGYTGLGRPVGATPDGRLAGEPLADDGSPSIGRAASGQTAAVNSYTKLPLSGLPNSIIDINFPARAPVLSHLESFIKAFLDKGGNVLNIVINNCDSLRAAQKEPEKYADLKIRVGGFEAYFIDLGPQHQELQIRRCEQYA